MQDEIRIRAHNRRYPALAARGRISSHLPKNSALLSLRPAKDKCAEAQIIGLCASE